MQGGQDKSLRRLDAEVFVVSVLILFLELALIRWISTEIRIFAYLGNLLLVVCFVGVGLGCYLADRPVLMRRLGVNLLLLAALVANPLHIQRFDLRNATDWLAGFEDSPMWDVFTASGRSILLGLVVVAVLLYLVLFSFLPLGQVLGRVLQKHPRVIRAYSINIVGSLVGIWLFNALSYWSTTPALWIAVAAILVTMVVWTSREWWAAVLVGAASVVVWCGRDTEVRTEWSPYQKLMVSPVWYTAPTNRVLMGYQITANNLPYQSIVNLSDQFLQQHPDLFDKDQAQYSYYNLPFRFRPGVRRLLILGAGTGDNAAAALRHGVSQVDCVEIDPKIYALGKELHPEQPYTAPQVRMIVNDARAFLKLAHEPYDMIWFALLDTHPGSAYNNVRLDHYMYTEECFREAAALLAEDGVLVMNFCSRREWISDRLLGMMRRTFGNDLIAFQMGSGSDRYGIKGEFTMFCAKRALTVDTLTDPALRDYIAAHRVNLPGTTRSTTDDWPYLYLQYPRIPKLHWCVMVAAFCTVALAGRRVFGSQTGFDTHFFALGVAFLLLEVQTVSRATLLFGMTWVVNSIVISALLVMILLANLVAWRWSRFPQWLTVSGLVVTVVALALVPLDWFNTLVGPLKLLSASVFLTLPVFFAGLIFIRSFAVCTDKSRALGSNLIGALVGGLLESLSFIIGIRALVVLVAMFYVVALWTRNQTTDDARNVG